MIRLKRRNAITLVEMLVALTVFSLVVAAASNILYQVYDGWRLQRQAFDMVQETRWAMERMTAELLSDDEPVTIVTAFDRIELATPAMAPGQKVFFWRGDGAAYGSRSCLYRGTGPSINQANAVRQELANFVCDNPVNPVTGTAYPLFRDLGNNAVEVYLNSRPLPLSAAGPKNQNVTVVSAVTVRND